MFITYADGKSLMNILEDTMKFQKGWNNWAKSKMMKFKRDKDSLKLCLKKHELLYM